MMFSITCTFLSNKSVMIFACSFLY